MGFNFSVEKSLTGHLGRSGVITTPHGQIKTPAFIPVGTKATLKSVLPESITDFGAQAVLANAYHLYLQPGQEVVDQAGGLGKFMNWKGPTFTDSGGFQVLSLGVQHQIGADIIFAFDECTTLHNTRSYQEKALERTRLWAIRCLAEHDRLTKARSDKPYQALFGVLQGAQYEDLRRKAAKDLSDMKVDGVSFDGFGIGGALDKQSLGEILRWVNEELPQDKPRHFLGIGEPDDLFVGVENGADTFDCVAPSRQARTSSVFTKDGRLNISNAPHKNEFFPIERDCTCYTCANYTRAYLCHLFRAKEMVAATLATIHNQHFIVGLVAQMRKGIEDGTFFDFKAQFMARYYKK